MEEKGTVEEAVYTNQQMAANVYYGPSPAEMPRTILFSANNVLLTASDIFPFLIEMSAMTNLRKGFTIRNFIILMILFVLVILSGRL